MRTIRTSTFCRSLSAWMVAIALCCSSGCATMAHRGPSGDSVRVSSACKGKGHVCPWVAADAAWLLAGVVPGVVALIVDFSTGAWNHDTTGDDMEAMTASDEMAYSNDE